MLQKPMDVLQQFPVRKSKKQKQSFRNAAQEYIEKQGYAVKIEEGVLGAKNVVIGNPDTAQYLVTAHYDTPASIGIPNLITPCNLPAFILIQLYLLMVFFAVSLPGGLLVGYLTDNGAMGYLTWYVLYMGMLVLMMFGPANPSNVNDNTSGVVTVLEILTSLPENQRDKVCFVLFDLEEAGLIGSASFWKAHQKTANNQLMLNLDCVGDGDEILFFPTKKLKANAQKLSKLETICGSFGKKSIALHKTGFAYYPSDQQHFPNGVGIAALRRKKGVGLYCSRIHTRRDTILDPTNVNILRAAIISLICQ